MISESPATMKKFVLRLRTKNYYGTLTDHYEDIMGLTRNFQRIRAEMHDDRRASFEHAGTFGICMDPEIVSTLVTLICHHGSGVRELSLIDAQFNSGEIRMIFKNAPLLEKLIIYKVKSEESTEPEVVLESLKNIQINNSDSQIFSCFSAPKLRHLEFSSHRQEDPEFLINFLQSSDTLESLNLYSWNEMGTILDVQKFKFKLKKLRLQAEVFNEQVKTLIAFLKSQAASLEDLEILCVPRVVLKDIFLRLNNLKILKLSPKDLQTDQKFYDLLRPSSGLKELIFPPSFYKFKNDIAARGILENCPNIEVLFARHINQKSKLLPVVAINNPKLKKLTINSIEADLGPEVNFKFLTYLEVDFIFNLSVVRNFIAKNPTIEVLKARGSAKGVKKEDLVEMARESNVKLLMK